MILQGARCPDMGEQHMSRSGLDVSVMLRRVELEDEKEGF